MKTPLVVLSLLAAGALTIKLWTGGHGDGADRSVSDPRLIFNRIWVDRLPRTERDTINAFAVVTRQARGIFQTTSRWKGAYELFQYEAAGEELRMVFPQTGDRERVRARAWSCNEGEMDYCLELTGASRGVKRYVSQKRWEIRASADPGQVRSSLEAIVAGAN